MWLHMVLLLLMLVGRGWSVVGAGVRLGMMADSTENGDAGLRRLLGDDDDEDEDDLDPAALDSGADRPPMAV